MTTTFLACIRPGPRLPVPPQVAGLMVRLPPTVICLAIASFIPFAAASVTGDPSGLWRPFAGVYKIHSGGVADRTLPTSQDRRLTVNFAGKTAKEVFDSLGPDRATTCSGEIGDRARE
jgi:hypothetical protein